MNTPPPLVRKYRHAVLGAIEQALHVHGVDPVELLFRHTQHAADCDVWCRHCSPRCAARRKYPASNFTSAAQSASLETSAFDERRPCRQRRLISRATRSPPSTLMSLTTTLQPSCAKRLEMPSPNPDPPPVTIATLSFNLISCSPPSDRSDSIQKNREPSRLPRRISNRHQARSALTQTGPSCSGRTSLLSLVPTMRQVDAVTHRGHLRQDRHRDLRRRLAADAQAHWAMQTIQLGLGQIELCQAAACA